jgi:hypothetical protein
MTDMLVKLYELPELASVLAGQQAAGINVRRALAAEKHRIADWVRENFSGAWGSECEVALSHHPVSCFVAVHDEHLVGFACHEATCKGFFGPIGVAESARDKGTGKALLLACLHDMWAQGYGYAIIGGVGPIEFYEKTVGATVIENSTPGIYRGLLRG